MFLRQTSKINTYVSSTVHNTKSIGITKFVVFFRYLFIPKHVSECVEGYVKLKRQGMAGKGQTRINKGQLVCMNSFEILAIPPSP